MSAIRHLCRHCDHFVDDNIILPDEHYFDDPSKPEGEPGLCRYVHLEDGEQEFDHDAEPGESATDDEWLVRRPDLFRAYPDGRVGPNSIRHAQRGKVPDYGDTVCACVHWYEEHLDGQGCESCGCEKFIFDADLNTPEAIADRGGEHDSSCRCALCRARRREAASFDEEVPVKSDDEATEKYLLDARFLSHGPNCWRRPAWPVSWHNQEYHDGSVRREPELVSVSTEEALRIARSERAEADARMLNKLASGLLAGGCEVFDVNDSARAAFERLHGRKPEVP